MARRGAWSRVGTVVSALAVGYALGGCNALWDVDGLSFEARTGMGGSGEDGGAGSSSSGGGDSCTCVAEAPVGWQGPVAVTLSAGKDLPACDPGWPVATLLAGVGEPGGPLSCSACSCELAEDEACPTEAQVDFFGDSGCTTLVDTITSDTGCMNAGGPAGYLMFLPVVPTGGSCAPAGGAAVETPEPFVQWAQLCEPASAVASCDGGVCVPALARPADTAVCIFSDGELPACPPGPWSDGPLVATSQYTDDRSCESCTCSSPSGGSCEGWETTLYANSNCAPGSTVGFASHPSTCASISSAALSNQLEITNAALTPGTCAAAGGEPKGTVTPGASITVCCLEP